MKEILEKIEHGLSSLTHRDEGRQQKVTTSHTYRGLAIAALIALIVQSGLLFLALFEPGLPYKIPKATAEDLSSPDFIQTLAALTGADLVRRSNFEALTNGDLFYEAELAAIRSARKSVNLEAYIFNNGDIAKRFIDAFTERAAAGVKVNLLIDAIGSKDYPKKELKRFQKAGGNLELYHDLKWYTWPRMNNRTHRELLIVDGTVGFIGGAGIADHWYKQVGDAPRWRDTMFRVEGEAVTGLQSAFAENWLETSGEILTGYEYFSFPAAANEAASIVVASAPTTGRSTSARVLFQLLLASAKKSIYITTPYFLPDTSIRKELERAIRERQVDVRIVVPGKKNDHLLTRGSSRRLYGDLLQAGAKIYEYKPAMTHTKTLVIDGLWSVAGSTNMDSRSFGINDEVNLAVLDSTFAGRLEKDFRRDVQDSRPVSYAEWNRRPFWERGYEWFGALVERQQ
jgi:cardiolipin synthase